MRCRDFNRDCADWLKGRLAEADAAAMERHAASCRTCAAVASEERALIDVVRKQPAPTLNADLWPQIQYRLEHGDPVLDRRLSTRRPLLRLGWGVVGLVAAVLAYVSMRPSEVDMTALVKPEDEIRVVEMIAATEPVRYVEASDDALALASDFETQRELLVGNGD